MKKRVNLTVIAVTFALLFILFEVHPAPAVPV